jgi:predicted porin
MKKSLLALAVLGAFAGAASAQSSVTIYGKLDQAFGKAIGTKEKGVVDTANQSRIGFRGYEDLGGGLGALFLLEHRLQVDTGAQSGTAFWNGNSFIGLKSNFGTVTIGRQYTSSYINVRNQMDPFSGETLAALRDIGGGGGGTIAGNPGNVGQVRVQDSVKYSHTLSGFTLSADIAEANQPTPALGLDPNKPWSVAFSYANGPLWAGVSYEDPQNTNDNLLNLGARYKFGPVTLSAGFATGHNTADAKVNAVLVGGIYSIGAGDIKLGYAGLRTKTIGAADWLTQNSRLGLGYHYNLSKRTKVFVDVARDKHGSGQFNAVGTQARTEKSAYDLGLQHNF